MSTLRQLLNLGVQYHRSGQLQQAEQAYRQVLQADPNQVDALHLLGLIAHQAGRSEAAIAYMSQALRLKPDHAGAHNSLGVVLGAQKKLNEALSSFREALRLKPDFAEAHLNLGLALLELGRLDEAVASLRQALHYRPGYAEAYHGLGNALHQQGKLEEAVAHAREALRLWPDFADAHNNLGIILYEQRRLDEAAASFRQALQRKPDLTEAHSNLGNILREQGLLDEALQCYREAVRGAPQNAALHSNLVYFLLFQPWIKPGELFEEHLRWAARHVASVGTAATQSVDDSAARRLRIGYVSGDFREHVMGYYLEPVLRAHDPRSFEITCYVTIERNDALTERIRGHAGHWRSLVGLSDDEAADLIRRDRIDILVDLAGHTAGNRLLVFARKPAPVQATHFGYAETTGMEAMDYRISDAHCDPPGMTEAYHTEKLVRLPMAGWCYEPPVAPATKPLPALATGRITFGSFNVLAKVTDAVIAVWAQVLHDVPGARMMVLTGAGSAADQRLIKVFAEHGIGRDRLVLLNRRPRASYFELYNDVDICLDTFPFTGCNTTCDAVWMGVPVVALAGDTCRARWSVTVLSCVGLESWIAATPAAYVELARRCAADLPRLAQLRLELRERMAQSPMTDVAGFTRRLEDAYRTMWRLKMTR